MPNQNPRFRPCRFDRSVPSLSILFFFAALGSTSVFGQEYLSGIQFQEPPVVDPGDTDDSPPSDAVVIFGGQNKSGFVGAGDWTVSDGDLVAGKGAIRTKESFGDCQVHLEWSAPTPAKGNGQGRGNSGLFLMNRYEIQILDSYDNPTYFDGQAGAIYKQTPPMVNATRPPGQWNTYDVIWTAPKFDASGQLSSPAYVTLFHNGIAVLNHFELAGDTPYTRPPAYQAHAATGPIGLQDHGNPVRFRNFWVRRLRPLTSERAHPPSIRRGDQLVPIEPGADQNDLSSHHDVAKPGNATEPDDATEANHASNPIDWSDHGPVVTVTDGHAFTEGPARDRSGGFYFTDIPNTTIHHVDAAGHVTKFTDQSHHANGLRVRRDGALLACEMDGQLVKYDVATKARTIVADQHHGVRFNACNDLVVDGHGGIYFTDPRYNAPDPWPQGVEAVYYRSADGTVVRVADGMTAPNGIALSPDGTKLYVAPSMQSAMVAFDVTGPGQISGGRTFCEITQADGESDGGSDGIAVDRLGNVYFTTKMGIEIVSPSGQSLHIIELPKQPANCAFVGPDHKTLVATARSAVYSITMPVAGLELH